MAVVARTARVRLWRLETWRVAALERRSSQRATAAARDAVVVLEDM